MSILTVPGLLAGDVCLIFQLVIDTILSAFQQYQMRFI